VNSPEACCPALCLSPMQGPALASWLCGVVQMGVMDTLSRLSHDSDTEVAMVLSLPCAASSHSMQVNDRPTVGQR